MEVDVNTIIMEHSIKVKEGFDAVFCPCGYTLYFPKVNELGVHAVTCPSCGYKINYYHLKSNTD